jgi:hypothetical protein
VQCDYLASYEADPANYFTMHSHVSGYTAGAAYKVQVKWTDASGIAGGTATVKDNTSNTTAASANFWNSI